jgi:phosphoserine phosphatase
MKKNKQKIFVSDVCGTLFYENTTLGFIRFYTQKKSKLKFLLFLILVSNLSPVFWSFKILEYFFSNNRRLFKKLIILFLKGEKERNIRKSAKYYINILLRKKKIEKVWDYLNNYKKNKFRIILASGSIEPVILEISKRIKADYISSSLELKNNKYTGYMLSDISKNKIDHLKLIGIDSEEINFFISDNFEDLDLIKNAKKGIAISHSSRNLEFWKTNKIKNLLCI